jgi:hypothetical protein
MTTAEKGTPMPTLATRCRQCPSSGGTVVAYLPGQEGHRSGHRAWELTQRTGHRHHDHYDPDLDAFLVIDNDG